MNMTRWLMVASLAMLTSTWAQAQAPPPPCSGPGCFDIQLTGWDDIDSTFSVTSSTTDTYTGEGSGFTQNSLMFCPSDSWECICDDPGGRLNLGPDATPFTGSATIPEGEDETANYINTSGGTLDSVEITATITNLNEDFTCSSDVFTFCGFNITDPGNTYTLTLLFTDPVNNEGIPSVPEPRQYALLLIAFGGLILAHRVRSRREAA
jgi:hypothetical protein